MNSYVVTDMVSRLYLELLREYNLKYSNCRVVNGK